MSSGKRVVIFSVTIILFTVAFIFYTTGCKSIYEDNKETNTMPEKSIEKVMEEHTQELMAIQGVVGVYQGQLKNGKPCITVMVEKETTELKKKIPAKLGGYAVVIEETGKIRPM